MTDFIVTAAALVAKVAASQGGEKYFYKGDILIGVNATEAARLKDIGLVAEVPEPVVVPEVAANPKK